MEFENVYQNNDQINSRITNLIINVKDYGAVGDGITDDTNAIKAAISNAQTNMKIVFFPAGTYNFTGATVPTHVSLLGEGAKSSILQYTPTTGTALFFTGKVNNLEKIKIYSPNNSTGYAIASSITTPITDFSLQNYEIEGFKNGIFIPYGLVLDINMGRILGQGSTIGEGIRLGDSHATVTFNMGKISESYVTGFSTAVTLIGSIMLIDQIIIDNSDNAINNQSRLFINGSWLQPNSYIFTSTTSGYPITATQNYYLTGIGGEIENLVGHLNMVDFNDLAAFQQGKLTSPGAYKLPYQTSFSRGLTLGTTNAALWENSGTLVIESSSASKTPFALQRNEHGVLAPLLELRRDGTKFGKIGLDANDNSVFISSNGSSAIFTIFTDPTNNTSISTNQSALSTTDDHGFLYVPSCPGVPTGTPKTLNGVVPIIVDTSDNRFYFYSGGAWRNAGP